MYLLMGSRSNAEIVSKKFIVISNLLLAAFVAYRLFDLFAEINYKIDEKPKNPNYGLVEIQRPDLKTSEGLGRIFGIQPTKIREAHSEPVSGSGLLNELVAGDEVIRLMGVFISEGVRYAVISFYDKKSKKTNTAGRKVAVGDKIKGYSVVSIQPQFVGLETGSSEQTRLWMFKTKYSEPWLNKK
jgi:hypothetical protein